MSDDPVTDATAFALVTESAGIATPDPWQLTPVERRRILARHHRRLLVATLPGRRRLRVWLDRQRKRPIRIESRAARQQRVARELHYAGDEDVFGIAVTTIAGLPRMVVDYLLAEVLVVVVGSRSHGWYAGALPAHRHVVVVAAHRTDEQLADTLRHECAHAWSESQLPPLTQAPARSAAAARLRAHVTRAARGDAVVADRFVEGLRLAVERQACALAAAWKYREEV